MTLDQTTELHGLMSVGSPNDFDVEEDFSPEEFLKGFQEIERKACKIRNQKSKIFFNARRVVMIKFCFLADVLQL